MALPATDAFTNTTGTQLTTHSSSWSLNDGDFDIQSNALAADDSVDTDECCANWNADAFANDHYSQIVYTGAGTGGYIGVGVRAATDESQNYYGCYATDSGNTFSFTVISGTWTQQGTQAGFFGTGNELKIEASGTSINIYKDDSLDATLSFTDASLTTGAAAVNGFGDGTWSADNWEGGNIGAGGSNAPLYSNHVNRLNNGA